jgi:4-hydroxybenzoate polyprenyltransferase
MPSIPATKLLHISRPRFWIYTFGPYIVGLLIGASQLADLNDWRVILFGIYFLFPANLFIYGINDIHDYDTDLKNPKKVDYETLVRPIEHRVLQQLTWTLTIPALLLAFFTNSRALWALLGFLFFSYFYSAPPIRAKARPLLDSMFNILYAFPGFFAYGLMGGQNFQWEYVVAAWCWTMAMHAYSAVPDISADRAANLDTVATKLGFQSTLWFCLALYATSAILTSGALHWLSWLLGALYITMMLISIRTGSEERLLKVYKLFPLLNTISGAAMFWYIALTKFYLL